MWDTTEKSWRKEIINNIFEFYPNLDPRHLDMEELVYLVNDTPELFQSLLESFIKIEPHHLQGVLDIASIYFEQSDEYAPMWKKVAELIWNKFPEMIAHDQSEPEKTISYDEFKKMS